MKKTGIYGGSFNPIHNGHLALARYFLRQGGLDEVWFVVSPQNPFKQDQQSLAPYDRLLPDEERLRMVELALQDEPQMEACDVEFRLPKPSYMWNTLEQLRHDHPDRAFVLIIGGDNWESFDRWYRAAEIKERYKILVYPRGGVLKDSPLPLLPYSSTAIRRRVSEGRGIRRMVPRAVADYIAERGFYRNEQK